MIEQKAGAGNVASLEINDADASISEFLAIDDYSDDELEARISKGQGNPYGYC